MENMQADKANLHEMKFPVLIMYEGNRFVAYTPLLDLSSSGETSEEARDSLSEAVSLFFEEIIARGTVSEVLQDLGWTQTGIAWKPPQVVSPSEFFVVHLPIEV